MAGEANEADKLYANEETPSQVKYKDPYTALCSTRWSMAAYIFLCFTLLYTHRVNLSLAVVCMVDTTLEETTALKGEHSGTRPWTHISEEVSPKNSRGNNFTFLVKKDNSSLNVIDTECGAIVSKDKVEWSPEIHWKKSEISILLSSYFYGSFFTQILSGYISDTFGGKHVITAAMLISTICSLLTPICARTSLALVFVIRISVGLAGGSVVPAGMSMIYSWGTPNEQPLMIAVSASGAFTGTIVTFLTSGLLCVYGFDNGWGSIFYIHGCITGLFTCLWIFEGYSLPSHHPRISVKELEYIESSKRHVTTNQRPKIPWKRLLLAKPLWATFIAHFSFNWSFFTILINIPLFLKEVLKFDVTSNGLYSALPFIFIIISSLACGKLSGIIIKRKLIGHLATRRLFSTACQLGMATCLVSAGYVSCQVRYIAVILLCLACTFAGFAYGGFLTNHPEYAGQFAGTAFGITNAGGVVASIVASIMAGVLTPNGLQEEWQRVFFLSAGINVIGTIAFLICSDVFLQPWARNHDDITIEIDNGEELLHVKKFNKEVGISEQDKTDDQDEISPVNDT
ncbi:uncharacterized transporter slc-17.2-like [Ruditapes philippinarum]|uniref:uncharacterized transporter slc-17.2-like n=1 Tax=Ruditapes philippinarum TaxID=129788 RepID=UPI00295B34CA|nr:uncharacterized transporter slc-17.2-like [Ruditapes philippinarum]XP_060605667.1 uncharacterized transporter slc-17.2-like [Ruditapes philippinarum]